ncbi:MAG: large repetitive protein [Verrucomicrobiota bacterium]|jgi:hypothetical protein
MKRKPPDSRNALSALRLSLALSLASLIPLLLYGSAPSWWSNGGVLIEQGVADDYALANQGQLKNIARAAAAEMDARLPAGAGDNLHNLISRWSTPAAQTSNFAPVNAGQLKTVAKPVYDRLIAAKYVDRYPWIASGVVPDDFGLVNIGQVKALFNFDLLATDAVHDANANGLPDWWEKYYFGNVGVDPNAAAPRGDGLTNLAAFQQGLDPINTGGNLAILPERVDETVPTGQTVTRTISITNNTSVVRQLSFAPHAAATTAHYSFTDSNQENGPQFVWNDISGTGVHLDLVSDGDDKFEAFPMSFAFPSFGSDYSTVYVCSNGFVTFGAGAYDYYNYSLPNSFAPAAMIAPFWNDLNLGDSGDVYYQDYGDRVVIQFENAARFDGDGLATFQIVLQQDGTVLFYYKEMLGTLDRATVGLQNATRNGGLTIAYDQPYLKSNLAVRIAQTVEWQQAPWLQVSPNAVSLLQGASTEITVTLDGRALTPGTFRGGLTANVDGLAYGIREIPVTMTLVDESLLDNDDDGLTNGQERALGTDPNKIDTDGDGMPDGWEIAHGLNPVMNDASGDPDGDGFANLQEYQARTDPFVFAAPARVVDTFDSWDYVVVQSGDWKLDTTNPGYFDGDTSRAARTSATTGSLIYWMPALESVDATIYYQGSLTPDHVHFYSSPDNATWIEVTIAKIAEWEAGGDWHGAVFRQSQGFSTDGRYFRIDLSGGDQAWTPQLSQIVFVHNDLNRAVADSRNLTVSAGASVAIALSGRDADADPLTYRIVEQPGHGALSGDAPNVIYTAATDYAGQDRFSFVANDGVRDSAPGSIYITVQALPSAIATNLTFSETSNSSAQLTWMAPSGGPGFGIERSTDGGLTWQRIGTVGGDVTSFSDRTYSSGTFYAYRVQALGQNTALAFSNQISSKGTDPTIADSDGDGVVDSREAQLHSNPDSKDSDGDGVLDNEDGAPSDPTRWAKPIERQYAVIDLGALPGSPGSSPLGINNLGHVLCAADPYGRYFLWQSGRRTELPGNFTPAGLNDTLVVGDTTYFYTPYSHTVTNGAYWSGGQVIRLPQLMVGYPGYPLYQTYTSSVRAVNNAGEIVGWSSPDESSLFATKWVAGGAGTALPARLSFKVWPFAISDSGAVLAAAQTDSGYDIDLLPSTRLATSRDANATSNGYGINSAGVIVSRGRQIWPQGAAGKAPQDINSLLAPESATTIDFDYTITNANEILADAHDGTGDADLVVLRLPTAASPAQVYKVVESDPRISWLAPIGMNDKGQIAATANYNDGSPAHAVLLVPAELMVDGNRDGEMSFDDPLIHDADQTSEEKPYRFWVNDDQDAGSGANNSEEVTPPEVRDSQDERIQSVRDCEDLARIWLNIGGLTEGFRTGAFKLVLRFRNITSGNPAVRVFRAAENGGRGYVTNEGWGNLQASTPFNRALPGTNGPGIASSTTGIHVDRQFWQGIDEFSPVINLLFEGVDEGQGELYFEIIDDAGRRIGESAGVWLDIKKVQRMFERAKGQPEDIVAPYTVNIPFVGPADYVADPNGNPFEKAWDETNQCVVFVHGWNVSYDEYLGVAQTMFKRLWHQGFKGHFATFRWDTRKSDNMFDAGEYNRSENRAYIYGAALRQWASRLSDAYTVNLIGHSMGNVVCGEALRQGLGIRNYLLMEAAIPMSCYVADAQRLPRLESVDSGYPTPDYHLNPTTNESTRGYRGYISNVTANLINFYNEADWALASGTSEIVPGLPNAETNWERNQIDYKPDGEIPGVIHAGTWRYYYDSGQGSARPVEPRAYVDSVASHDVRDSWEMKAFVARSRTKAVGAFPGGGSLGAAEDLRGSFGFRDIRTDHSGQFTRDIQAVDALYKRIRERIEE